MQKIKRGSKVAEELAQDILRKVCAEGATPGSRLPSEATMVAEYGVGRGSLREALRILEIHGIIRIKAGPGGGPVVVGPTTTDFGRMATMFFQAGAMTFREVIDARLLLEPMIARMAAERREPELVEQLLAAETSTSSDAAYLKTSANFHWQVGSMSGNRILNLMSHALEDIFHARVVGMLFPPERREAVVEAHHAIAEAIARGDADAAERLMREHMVEYARYVEQRHPALIDEIVEWH
ncbi:FadR/GntR family transcriptional regulator [Sphingomonas immobilis]|uniref:FCD domain-containing protein n=1 Tax=Sphingomonas immobilis TaxID=3063997 RepID=A0ABT9A015_9SPHN|nr:FCD domain-containing protein [Sphingomonas sp. CA1-15]MDO7843179.1 FCD domain-containing protein [Sphingomonas sp. CA1-15]